MVQGLLRASGIVDDLRHHEARWPRIPDPPWRLPEAGMVRAYFSEKYGPGKITAAEDYAGSFFDSRGGSILPGAEGRTQHLFVIGQFAPCNTGHGCYNLR
jgi:hypothetical protein